MLPAGNGGTIELVSMQMYAPTTLVPARDFWQYCFFLWQHVHACFYFCCYPATRHASAASASACFCFCLHEFLKNFILLCDG
ncbi:hypothetical protein PVAP13_7KG261310 [Panicum virgatum]|uniref:Uncharacterized protein n=1 Tax=Panicum virgatum TaxID=38727 RepID=A0A8T0QJC6_PANVG|nr:hypothetical protein PVAP13_7KG261310 [Panicum virgatum]